MTELSRITVKGNLIEKSKWRSYILSLQNSFEDLETNKERAKRNLKTALTNAIKKRITDNFGVLLSGGIDSTLIAFICKQFTYNFNCYTVGMENSPDLLYAEEVAQKLNLRLRTKTFTLEEFESILKKVASIIKEPDTVKISVGTVMQAASELAKNDNVNSLFSGLGSEEIFAGYERHWNAFQGDWKNIHQECWSGLIDMWSRDLKRDYSIATENKTNLLLPFLDEEVINAAMNIHPMYKINEMDKKIILRETAEDMGLQKEFCWRKKKAAQYGSYFQKAIEKLAKKAGFKYIKPYLKSLL